VTLACLIWLHITVRSISGREIHIEQVPSPRPAATS